jgi:valyl-tRNA synthetase
LDDTITKCEKCGGATRKDIDTFDTWFSSGQWPYATLGFPNGSDYKTYYPTDVMETTGDLVFFWVSRMVMLGLYVTGDIPFKTVYYHGMVLDAKGQKMSKSKGNVISPMDLTPKYGTDAFRIGLIIGNTPGTSLALAEDKIKAYKNFANKIWNISRFILTNTEGTKSDKSFASYSEQDKKLIETRDALIKDITSDMDEYRFYLAGEKIYHYAWHELADVILEDSKKIFESGSEEEKISRKQFLIYTLKTILILLHPFMPFITEELWGIINGSDDVKLIVEPWPYIS